MATTGGVFLDARGFFSLTGFGLSLIWLGFSYVCEGLDPFGSLLC